VSVIRDILAVRLLALMLLAFKANGRDTSCFPQPHSQMAFQPGNTLVEIVALCDVDDFVLAALFDQLLHAVYMHRLFVKKNQDGKSQWGSFSHNMTLRQFFSFSGWKT
jgi:hypothetical protein